MTVTHGTSAAMIGPNPPEPTVIAILGVIRIGTTPLKTIAGIADTFAGTIVTAIMVALRIGLMVATTTGIATIATTISGGSTGLTSSRSVSHELKRPSARLHLHFLRVCRGTSRGIA
jgi:hypothetical protein